MFYASSLSDAQADEIAEAYFKAGRSPAQMAKVLQVVSFDANLLKHPLVKRKITKMAIRMREAYSLEDHLSKLQEIRDMALEDGNYRIALSAEISVGKAAGLYERVAEQANDGGEDLAALSTEELRKRLASLGADPMKLAGPDVFEEDGDTGEYGEEPLP